MTEKNTSGKNAADENTVDKTAQPLTPAAGALPDGRGDTGLHMLCRDRETTVAQIADYLDSAAGSDPIRRAAFINRVNAAGLPALSHAIVHAPAAAAYLIEQGAALYQPAADGRIFNATLTAAAHGDLTVLQTVLDKGGNRYVNRSGIDIHGNPQHAPALHAAVQRDRYTMITPLLRAGALPDALSGTPPSTPLMIAAYQGNYRCILPLVRGGADVNACNDAGDTALHIAIANGRNEAAKVLLQYGAAIEARNKNGETPLFSACISGTVQGVRLLAVEHGAQINLHRNDGRTPLMLLADRHMIDALRSMIAVGADPLLTDNFNRTARQYADNNQGSYNTRNTVLFFLHQVEEAAKADHFDKAYNQLRKNKPANGKPGAP